MPELITDFSQTIKTSCDNDTFLFHFKGSKRGEAFKRLDKEGNETTYKMYYYNLIMPRMVNEMTVNIYYKNTNGVWVDYRKATLSYPRIAIQIAAVTYEEYLKVNLEHIPPCIYMDENNYIHYIDEYDGSYPNDKLPLLDIDESKAGLVSYRPYSLEEPHLPFSARHVMTDLKVKVTNIPSRKLFVWLNGTFVPIIHDTTYEDVFYIKNAMTAIGSRCVNQKLNSPWNYVNKTNATIIEDSIFNEYRLDARLRFFAWKNVKPSLWYSPLTIRKIPIVYNYASIYIIKDIVFPEAINKNAHMILDNGIILDQSEYIIDPDDPRKVTLKYVEIGAYSLLNEIIKDIKENVDIYGVIKPLSFIEQALINHSYSLVNFSLDAPESENDGKKVHLKRSIACATDFPYKDEITFSDIDLGDLITINGTFNEYEWIHKHTIALPRFQYSYKGPESSISEDSVVRYYFICK
jgi:hypothetical protein